jgi:hypothetical protein
MKIEGTASERAGASPVCLRIIRWPGWWEQSEARKE